jgi:ectoine hydroxylase-related dioxygenase (phytanoyl-CoA dioxygenase family)
MSRSTIHDALVACQQAPATFRLHGREELGVPIYASESLLGAPRSEVLCELVDVLAHGPGVFVIEGAVDRNAVERASDAFFAIIERERAAGGTSGDHFAKPGANSRIWNALEKLADADPDAFCDYYESPSLAVVFEAWLGPWSQVTSQVNVVNPGGEAQQPHCDFHLGFQDDAVIARFPAHVHALSPMLTLQGAVAHCDMPVQTGPTSYLPHSQKLRGVYGSWRRQDLIDAYAELSITLPLRVGDAVFFNPSLLHAAGTNRTTGVRRMVNLLQVSSAMGRAMESVDRSRLSRVLFPALSSRRDTGWSDDALARVVAASSEGYAFPTNLDRDQPIGRLTPVSQAEVVFAVLTARRTLEELDIELREHDWRRLTK